VKKSWAEFLEWKIVQADRRGLLQSHEIDIVTGMIEGMGKFSVSRVQQKINLATDETQMNTDRGKQRFFWSAVSFLRSAG
jgi:hypothetical protein